MLLIDGIEYNEWTDLRETEDLEPMVNEHAKDIFGDYAFYFDRKQKLKSLSGIGSIPDGYVISLGDNPQWHIIEAELSSHPLHEHIVSQVSKFIVGIRNSDTQREITNRLYDKIIEDEVVEVSFKKQSGCKDIHKFLADLISGPPILTIVIEKNTEELAEALDTLNHSLIKIVEFRTFRREGSENVHIHQFEPLKLSTKSLETKSTASNITPIVRDSPANVIATKIINSKHNVVVNPTGEKLSRTKFVERFASASERNSSITARNWPHTLIDTNKKFADFISKHPECVGWTLQQRLNS